MSKGRPRVLAPDRAYAEWVTTYDAENAVTTLDAIAVRDLTPDLFGKRLLDVACGTGRRLRGDEAARASLAVGVDRLLVMLQTGRSAGASRLIAGDLHHLPLGAATFDVVWCRLALGHVRDLVPAYREFHRILETAGCLVVTDFHPAAANAGHQRTYRDPASQLRAVEFDVHDVAAHLRAAQAAGLLEDGYRDLKVGPTVRRYYEAAGKLDRYRSDQGLPLLLALRFRR